jgi:hypothetical protein
MRVKLIFSELEDRDTLSVDIIAPDAFADRFRTVVPNHLQVNEKVAAMDEDAFSEFLKQQLRSVPELVT